MDPETMQPITEKVGLIYGHPSEIGFDRIGENGKLKKTERLDQTALADAPFIEGAFMNKYEGRYYLQYSSPGTQYNTYCDGVYTSDQPLGLFALQKSNPFSSKPGGFITAAGHGSTIKDEFGNWWHVSSMRISINHIFERRLGLWPAGFDHEGTLFCNQNFGDYPIEVPEGRFNPLSIKPKWMLLSYKKIVETSSFQPGYEGSNAVNEDIQSSWRTVTNQPGEWLSVDLGELYDVRAIQVNIADGGDATIDIKELDMRGPVYMKRLIHDKAGSLKYKLMGGIDGKQWSPLERDVSTIKPHELFHYDKGQNIRFVKIIFEQTPYSQQFSVSGFRVFGNSSISKPSQAHVLKASLITPLDALIKWEKSDNAIGYNVVYGNSIDSLYHSWLVYEQTQLEITTLIKNKEYYVRVDSFGEGGITEGIPQKIQKE